MAERARKLVSAEQMEEQQLYTAQVRALPERPRSFHVVTYGCQMNAHDSEYLAGMLKEMGMNGNKVKLEFVDGKIVIEKPEE